MTFTASLTGWRLSGKSTFANQLVEKHGFLCVQFADALYVEAAGAYGLNVMEFLRFKARGHETPVTQLALRQCRVEGYVDCVLALDRAAGDGRPTQELLDIPRSYRRTLQTYGTDWRRAQDPDYWIKRLDARLSEHGDVPAVITDVRHLNEFQFGESLGPVIRVHNVEVDREMRARIERGDIAAAHDSETQMMDRPTDLVLVNHPGQPERMYEDFFVSAAERGWDLDPPDRSKACRAA